MAEQYLSVDREQQFLLPPDMRAWLAEDHLVWFLLDALGTLDLSGLHDGRRGGVGRRGYDPEVLLAVLLYGYCSGVRSSRKLEGLCGADVAFRVIAGGYQPDHTTLARFRNECGTHVEDLFVQVLELCAAAGLVDVGIVAVDGTKMAGDASINRNRTREWVERAIAEAAEVDAVEDAEFGDARGDELPEQWRSREGRKERMNAVLAELEARRKAEQETLDQADGGWLERAAVAETKGQLPQGRRPAHRRVEAALESLERSLADNARKIAVYDARKAAGETLKGQRPLLENRIVRVKRSKWLSAVEAAVACAETAGARHSKVNLTDPESKIMPTRGKGWIQGYNAQAAVTEDGIVLAVEVFNTTGDADLAKPLIDQSVANAEAAGAREIGTMLFDAGYFSEKNIEIPGPDRLIAFAKSHTMKKSDPTSGPPPLDASPVEAMRHRLRTPEGAAIYMKRQHTVEPVFGDWKHLRAFRQFSLRGLIKVNAEWRLQAIAHNLTKAHRSRLAI